MADILYQDKQVTICKDLIIINKYYFPLATSRQILFSEIEQVAMIEHETSGPQWGVCPTYLNNWFPYNSERSNKKKFIEIKVRGSDIKPSITPDYPEIVLGLIWEYHTKDGLEYLHKCEEKLKEEEEKRSRKMSECMQDNKNPENNERPEEIKGRKEGKENAVKKTEIVDVKGKERLERREDEQEQRAPEVEENPLRVIELENK